MQAVKCAMGKAGNTAIAIQLSLHVSYSFIVLGLHNRAKVLEGKSKVQCMENVGACLSIRKLGEQGKCIM